MRKLNYIYIIYIIYNILYFMSKDASSYNHHNNRYYCYPRYFTFGIFIVSRLIILFVCKFPRCTTYITIIIIIIIPRGIGLHFFITICHITAWIFFRKKYYIKKITTTIIIKNKQPIFLLVVFNNKKKDIIFFLF